jgi:hypothetical protein
LLHAIDSDWGFVVVEPWPPNVTAEFFAAAAPAFREPYIGRKLPAALRRAGFREIRVAVEPIVDTTGLSTIILENMAGYIAAFDTMPRVRVAALLAEARAAVDRKEYLFVLPQFLVTAAA